MTDFDEPESLEELQAAELYPCANVIAELTFWVLESTRYPYEDMRRWECILRYFTLMKETPILFTYYVNIRVNVIAKISEIQEHMMGWNDFMEDNRPLFTILYDTMNEVLVSIGGGTTHTPSFGGGTTHTPSFGGGTQWSHNPHPLSHGAADLEEPVRRSKRTRRDSEPRSHADGSALC